jgi:MFS family permease
MRTILKNNKVIGAFLGTIVEYYDYSLYGFSIAIIASKFFNNQDSISNLTNAFAVYAFSYFAKPLGSLIFSSLGDWYGRKIALSITILGIAIPTTFIGLLPTYEDIGVWSTIILVACRFIQSIFAAGEYDGAAIYVIEHLGEKHHYTASAIIRCSGVVGLLLGIGASNLFSSHIFPEWGWRIPFLLSLPLAFVALYYRRKFEETPQFEKIKKSKQNVATFSDLVKGQKFNLLMVIILAGGFGVTYQVSIIFMKQYLPIVAPPTQLFISTFSIILVACFGVCMPIAGVLADKFGQLKIILSSLISSIIWAGFAGVGIYFQMINLILISLIALSASVAPVNALAHGIAVKAFPVQQRYRGIGIAHTIGSVLMSGSANFICMKFIGFGFYLFPMLYVMIFSFIACFIIFNLEKKYLKAALSSSNDTL